MRGVRMRRVWWLALALGCNGDNIGGNVVVDTDVDDLDGPTIEHAPIEVSQTYGIDVLVDARVTDPSGVTVVEVVYQQETASQWKNKAMFGVGGDLFQGNIPGQDVGSGGMRYFLRALDDLGNQSCLPEDCEPEAWHFGVVPP